MLKVVAFLLVLLAGLTGKSKSAPPCIDPISTVDWQFFIDALEFKGVCVCTSSGRLKVGVKIQLAEPIAFIETPNKAWDFKCVGSTRSKFSIMKKDGTNQGKYGQKNNVHYIKYPVFYVLNVAFDNLCTTQESWDIIPTGLSEINPLLWDDDLSIMVQPHKLLFSNPVAQAVCLADCVATSIGSLAGVGTAELVTNSLFWCAGCWGAIAPDTTTVKHTQDRNVTSGLVATRLIDMMHMFLQMKMYKEVSGMGWAGKFSGFPVPTDVSCQPMFFPIIVKSQYWMNLAYPVSWDAIPIGDFPLKWAWFKTIPSKEDGTVWALWRIRTCCVGFQFP